MTDLRDVLEGFIAERLPRDAEVRVGALERLGGGSSQENWAFEASWGVDGQRKSRDLLLRREPESGVVETSRDVEFSLLRALSRTDLPIPVAYWLDDGTVFGRPAMVVERREGRAHRAALRDVDPLSLGEPGRLGLARELADLLARVHCAPLESETLVSIFGAAPSDPAASELNRWTIELDRVEMQPQPALRLALSWLRYHRPAPPERLALVHGDFRPANILIHEGRTEALLDWELARIGDPIDDLGWYTCSVYRREHFVPGQWDVDDFLARYASAAGLDEVEPGRLRFWQVMSVVRLAVIALAAARNFCDGTTDRPMAYPDALVRQAVIDTGLVA